MRILFYAPFKPLGHPNPSGDLVIGTGLFAYLRQRGHQLAVPSILRTRWIYWKPARWPQVIRDRRRAVRLAGCFAADLWLSYHPFYKAPDVLGPAACRQARLPYVIFQGAYATKRRRDVRTVAGFHLNRRSLLAADHVFSNRRVDYENLSRIVPPERLTYVAPGIVCSDFTFDARAREALRDRWQAGGDAVVLSAAMFRPGVKTRGLSWVIRACGRLLRRGRRLLLVIAGEGRQGEYLRQLARRHLGRRVRFVGKVPRDRIHRFYSAGDLFAFPGFRESLGMVFLEAQACGLPVVAFAGGGIPEVVDAGRTGILTPPGDFEAFTAAVDTLVTDREMRRSLGRAAAAGVRRRHDLTRNYAVVEQRLTQVVRQADSADRSRRPRG